MIDLHRLRTDSQAVLDLLYKKDPSFDGKKLLELDKQIRELKLSVDALRCEKNELAKKGQAGVSVELKERSKVVSAELKEKEASLNELDSTFQALYLRCPNLLMESVPSGNKEQNVEVKLYGEKPQFNFTPRNHVELGQINGWFDFEAAARMAGSNFSLYKGHGVVVAYKLMIFMLTHNMKRGFVPVAPPFLVNEKTLQGAGNWPRFKEEVYHVQDEDLFLTPTSEVNLTSMYRDQILSVEDLPLRMTAWTSCFRREAGGYGATERGLIRVHQFDKAEIYSVCSQDKAEAEQDYMLETAEALLQALGLHYRVCLLAAQDCSFSSAKTYDIEVWLPGQACYKEVSSVSNCTDFQARRSEIRYRDEPQAKPKLVHTLNGSSLALPRLLVALMETYQQSDGTIQLPSILDSITLT
jgi:seryl-tRNA synthetase